MKINKLRNRGSSLLDGFHRKNSSSILYKLKNEHTYQSIEDYMKKFISLGYKKQICGIPFPRNLSELGTGPDSIQTKNIIKELTWYSLNIKYYAKEINDFLILKKNYEYCILKSEYQECYSILKQIFEKFGYSIWLIESQISLIQSDKGVELKNKYTKSLFNKRDEDPVVKFLTFYISSRADLNTSSIKYKHKINELIIDLKESGLNILASYIPFKLSGIDSNPDLDLIQVMAREFSMSMIDRYLTFMKVIEIIIASKTNNEITPETTSNLIFLLGRLIPVIEDENLKTLLVILGGEIDYVYNKNTDLYYDALDQYTNGNYLKSAELSERIIKDDPTLIEMYEINIKSKIRVKNEINLEPINLIQVITGYLLNIILKNNKANDSFLKLSKIIDMFSHHKWAAKINAIVVKEYSSVEFDIQKSRSILFGVLNLQPENPLVSLHIIDEGKGMNNLEKLKKMYSERQCIRLYESLILNDIPLLKSVDIPNERKNMYLSRILTSKNDYLNAKKLYTEMIDSSDRITKQDSTIGLLVCLLELNNIDECLKLMIRTYFHNVNMYVRMPIIQILDRIENGKTVEGTNKITLSILYDICTKYINFDKETLKFEAYEDFLDAIGIDKPSKIMEHISEIDKEILIYFLRFICVFNIMDNHVVFNSTKEIEKERIEIYNILCEIDSSNKKLYLIEIENISERLMIIENMQNIEMSKIYVDVDGIKKTIEKNIKESFIRYKNMESFNTLFSFNEYITFNTENGELIKIRLPINEKENLLNSMILEIRNFFVSSNQYGLDGYLSLGIRHGTITGQLRSPLEVNKLITKRDYNNYHENVFWKNKYEDKADVEKLLSFLAEFSEQIDVLIDMIKNQWIRINIEDNKNPLGLFDYSIYNLERELLELKHKINDETPYEEFIDIVFSYLWQKTDMNLAGIRSKITFELKRLFDYELVNLEKNIKMLDLDLTELNSYIYSARISIQRELDKLTNWFTRDLTAKYSDYFLATPCKVAIEMLRPKNVNLIPIYDIDESLRLKGQTLGSMTQIFYILIANVIEHSNLDVTKCNIIFLNRDGFLVIEVKNEINIIGKDYDELVSSSAKRVEKLNIENEFDKVNTEGGSGLLKIIKILSVDLGCKHTINIEVESKSYKVIIKMNGKELLC
ncbi:hypothetical protein [Paenibacillus agricola]|uniref:Uncharacterized protein n=1 Tax=Paenibacillus agricola TaxID=2716264 RepID=A0ABX0JIN5_9BACL|nr:hypothetical protein [Paenibacillus agricola]NHN34857.1 hypothetical protein [Paenibacillus agricola]